MNIRRMAFCLALLGVFAGGLLLPVTASSRGYPVKGDVIAVQPINDMLGSGVIVYSRYEDNNARGYLNTNTIHAYRFNNYGGSMVKIWQINDGVWDCGQPYYHATFKGAGNGTPMITDLNGNGISEIWVGYTYSCKGYSGPDDYKIIMYEGKKKYAVRGMEGGPGTLDLAFRSGPGAFRAYAQKLWNHWMNGF